MGIKYLLRGIGIGIVVTAVVLGGVNAIDAKKEGKSKDTPASSLTTEAGTTEDSSLHKILEQNQIESTTRQAAASTESSSETTKSDNEASQEPASEASSADNQIGMNDKETTETRSLVKQDYEEDDNTVIRTKVKIPSGMNCTKLAKLLEEEGMITDAEAFSSYMEYHGYDNRLRVGEYAVSSDMTYKELAELFMTRIK